MSWDDAQRQSLESLRAAYRDGARSYKLVRYLNTSPSLVLTNDLSRSRREVGISRSDYDLFKNAGLLLDRTDRAGTIATEILTYDAAPAATVPTFTVGGIGHTIALQLGSGHTFTGDVRSNAVPPAVVATCTAAMEAARRDLPQNDWVDVEQLLVGAIAEAVAQPARPVCVSALLAAAVSRSTGAPAVVDAIERHRTALSAVILGSPNKG